MMVCNRISMKGTKRLKISQKSISLTYEVLGSESDTLMNNVTKTRRDVRLTVATASKSDA